MGTSERMNVFRRFFASSRYGRLIIRQLLVRSAIEKSLTGVVVSLEAAHNQEFLNALKTVSDYGFLDEFTVAVKEEDSALQKIIEAYDKRMEGRM